MTGDRRKLEERLGHRFSDDALLDAALTHRSVAAAHNYERLEFLGDALLGFIIAQILHDQLPQAAEGDLSRLRASLVRKSTLAALARDLNLGPVIVLGPGEMKSGGHRRDSILADVLEALLGAIFKDAGYNVARQVVARLFDDRLKNLPSAARLTDAKTRLQEWLQSRGMALPVYTVEEISGAAHKRHFRIGCAIADLDVVTHGEGTSRRRAEQASAEQALEQVTRG